MLSQIGLAIVTFIITNIDDLLILSLYFSNPKYKTKNIVGGQYLGISTLVIVSLIGILAGEFISKQWLSLLGIFPLLLGIRDLVALRKNDDDETQQQEHSHTKLQFLSVALVTIANGGDNIGVYAPLFATINRNYLPLYIIIFAILTAVWCFLGYWFVSHQRIRSLFSKYSKIILPFFLIVLGIMILRNFFY
jgi:cadmium resistance protein CadD (predicted permease)